MHQHTTSVADVPLADNNLRVNVEWLAAAEQALKGSNAGSSCQHSCSWSRAGLCLQRLQLQIKLR